jgi:amidase
MAISEQVALWSTTRQAAAIRDGEFTSRQLLELLVARVERINPAVNAVVTFELERARGEADAADARLAKGELDGPLHGVPVTMKDALETEGIRSTGGATELHNNVPAQDAPVVRAVREAGAIVFGKTNLPRWSGDIQSFNEMFGTTNNPWNLERVPGGSSGGAAAAVATGMTSFEIGTDIGGSIRFPASFNGIYGHKPSWGVVPSTGYLDHEAGGGTEADVNVIGPLARSAEDLTLLLDLLQRQEGPLVANLAPAPADVTRMRVAAWLDDAFCPVDSEVLAVLNAATDRLEESGVTVDRAARPAIDPARASSLGVWLVGLAISQSNSQSEYRHKIESEMGTLADQTKASQSEESDQLSSGPSHRAWLDANVERAQIREQWGRFFEDFDAIIMPVAFVPPFAHQQDGDFATRTLVCNGEVRPYADIVKWTILTGMAYLPATVPPIGQGTSGLPISLQVVGPYGSDYSTIALAAHIGELCGGFSPPAIAVE